MKIITSIAACTMSLSNRSKLVPSTTTLVVDAPPKLQITCFFFISVNSTDYLFLLQHTNVKSN